MVSSIVDCDWLLEHYRDSDLVVLYTRACAPGTDVLPEQPEHFIPGSQLFDFEKNCCATHSMLPHTLPSSDHFQHEVRKLGINKTSTIVVYDQTGLFTSPRVWWMFMVYGFSNIYVLDGGLPAWLNQDGPTQSGFSLAKRVGDFVSDFQSSYFYDLAQVKSRGAKTQLMDARSQARFSGKQADPRQGVRAGHIPGSSNLPFDHVVNNGFLKPIAELMDLFPQDTPLVFTCGSGVTACILALAAHECGVKQWAVYDGSWAEWGSSPEPIAIDTSTKGKR